MQSKTTEEAEYMKEQANPPCVASANLPELLARVDNDREFLCDLISIFEEEFPRYLKSLRDAVARSDSAEVVSVSHTLKGMLSNLAASRAAAAVER